LICCPYKGEGLTLAKKKEPAETVHEATAHSKTHNGKVGRVRGASRQVKAGQVRALDGMLYDGECA